MIFHFVTLFPEMIQGALGYGVVGQAIKNGYLTVGFTNPRDFASGVHRAVDDRPFGGGDGMVMLPEILSAAIASACGKISEDLKSPENSGRVSRRIFLSGRGPVFNNAKAKELAQEEALILICGRYGGIDERLLSACDLEEVSVGDFILSGGEIAALAVTDAIARHRPQVLGNQASATNESFASGLLEHPQFTRPREWRGMIVPEILTGGNHSHIEGWRESLGILVTAQNRPDLLNTAPLDEKQLKTALNALGAMSLSQQNTCGLTKLDLILDNLNRQLVKVVSK